MVVVIDRLSLLGGGRYSRFDNTYLGNQTVYQTLNVMMYNYNTKVRCLIGIRTSCCLIPFMHVFSACQFILEVLTMVDQTKINTSKMCRNSEKEYIHGMCQLAFICQSILHSFSSNCYSTSSQI